jgi:hypothetical protein
VPSDRDAEELNEINALRTNDHPSTATRDPWLEDLRRVSLKIFNIERSTDKMVNDSIRFLEKSKAGKISNVHPPLRLSRGYMLSK